MNSLRLDYANCTSDRVGAHGLDPRSIRDAATHLASLTDSLNASRGKGWERWRLLPFHPMRKHHVTEVRRLVRRLRGKTNNLIVLGIGGSALGNIALHAALNPPTWNLLTRSQRKAPRLFILDNVDPELIHATFEHVRQSDPGFKRTVVNVVSKSGETAETAAQFMLARSMLKAELRESYKDHIVAVTDQEKGTMRAICDREGYATLPVPDGVGGRFSVLSPVGLFSAAMCNIDVDALLDGAADMDQACSRREVFGPGSNPAAIVAHLLIELTRQRGKIIHVMMPYSNNLYFLADWYRQLWAESLGKRHDLAGKEVFAGATPIKALGTTDQHSQVQLYRDGPNDKVISLIGVQRYPHDVEIPSDLGVEALEYLEGRTLGELINAERRATEFALVESQRPNFTITFPQLDAYTVGQFIQLWEITTAYAGLMLDINTYDQPAVETGKVATFGLMGRKGYDEWKSKVERALAPTSWTV